MQTENDMTLGLDLGTNSIGWALIRNDGDNRPVEIVRTGVRVFQEAVEAKTRTPKNFQRRTARSARKILARRASTSHEYRVKAHHRSG